MRYTLKKFLANSLFLVGLLATCSKLAEASTLDPFADVNTIQAWFTQEGYNCYEAQSVGDRYICARTISVHNETIDIEDRDRNGNIWLNFMIEGAESPGVSANVQQFVNDALQVKLQVPDNLPWRLNDPNTPENKFSQVFVKKQNKCVDLQVQITPYLGDVLHRVMNCSDISTDRPIIAVD